jgi:DNA-binding response OmpR family regulator
MPISKQPRSASILVADDEPAIARLIASILLTQYRVETAGSAEDAMRQMSAGSPDLLIVDASMKGRDALVRATELGQPSCAVLYISGFGEGQIRELGIDVAGSNFLLKPFTMSDLFDAVRRALGKAAGRHSRARTSRPHA